MLKIQVRPSRDGQWYVRVVSRNGRTLLNTEMYKSKRYAFNLAKRLALLLTDDTEVKVVSKLQRLVERI